jgi:Ca2+/Na+ antiporter
MQLHGALTRDQEDALVAHLARCESCRAFQDLTKGTNTLMAQHASMHIQTLDWDALFARTQAHLRRYTREKLVTAGVVCAALVPMIVLVQGHAVSVVLTSFLACVVALVVLWWRSRAERNRPTSESDAGDLLFAYRRLLEDRLRRTRRTPLVYLAWLLAYFYMAREQLVSTHAWLGFGGMACVFAATFAYYARVRQPQIRKELDALKANTVSK